MAPQHSTAYLIGHLYIYFRDLMLLPLCGMMVIAVLAAYRKQQRAVLSWLLPLAIGHGLGLLYSLCDLTFRLLHLRSNLAWDTFAYTTLAADGIVVVYASWRVLTFVTHLPIMGGTIKGAALQEGVWPPPPTQTR